MFKLILICVAFFFGYFIADLEIIEIPFDKMPYLEEMYNRAE